MGSHDAHRAAEEATDGRRTQAFVRSSADAVGARSEAESFVRRVAVRRGRRRRRRRRRSAGKWGRPRRGARQSGPRGSDKKNEEVNRSSVAHRYNASCFLFRIFGGLIQDVKRKSIYYASDIKDALSLQCIASILFIFFASISPAITFGGVLGGKTDNLEVKILQLTN